MSYKKYKHCPYSDELMDKKYIKRIINLNYHL